MSSSQETFFNFNHVKANAPQHYYSQTKINKLKQKEIEKQKHLHSKEPLTLVAKDEKDLEKLMTGADTSSDQRKIVYINQ